MEKTCGNCGNAIPIPIEGEDGTMNYDMISVCPCDWSIDLIRSEPSFDAHTPDRESCEEWVEQKEKPLEQRYQQLAEVARDMLKFLKNIEREYPRLLDPNRKPGGQILYPMPSDEYANQLEELGVEV